MEEKNNNIKLYLIMFLLILICLLIFNYFLRKTNDADNIWNYSNIDTVSTILYKGTKTTNREIYYTLNEIVTNYIEAYLVTDENSSWQNYYEVLSDEYNNYLNRKEYNVLAEDFLKKFYVYSEDIEIEANEYMDVQEIITKIYEFEGNKYICVLESSITGNVGYIGIQLNEKKEIYSIFYLE